MGHRTDSGGAALVLQNLINDPFKGSRLLLCSDLQWLISGATADHINQ